MPFQTIPLQRSTIGNHFRVLGLRGASALINPFLNVDHAWMSAPTFPPHPHGGFSAVSYVFEDSETAIHNRDSLGSDNLIRPGGLHWVTAGSGVVHQEDPAELGKTVHSLQIFVALSPEKQGMKPFTLSLEPEDVPIVRLPSAEVRVALGQFGSVRSPLSPPTEVTMLDISMQAGGAITLPVAAAETMFVLPVSGSFSIEGDSFGVDDEKVPIFSAAASHREVQLVATENGRLVALSGAT